MSVIKVVWLGRRHYERRMRAARSKFRKEQKLLMRQAGKVVLRAARQNIRSAFATHGSAKDRSGGKTLSQATKVSVRSRRGVVSAEVGAEGRPGQYGRVLEEGREVRRGGVRTVEHNAQYPKIPWLAPAVKSSEGEVFTILGKAFRVV